MVNEHTSAPIVVGYDGTDGARVALDWAIAEAAARKSSLRIVHAATSVPTTTVGYFPVYEQVPQVVIDDWRARCAEMIAQARHRVEELAPQVVATAVTTETDRPAHLLTRESLNAAMIVLGSRGLGPLGSAFFGSVGSAVAQRAHCPVVVVRGPALAADSHPRVVIGIDGRGPAEAAIEFAFDHAAARGLALVATLCVPSDVLAEMGWRPEQPAPDEADALVSEAIAGWREKYPDVDVHTTVIRDRPVPGLVAAATSQDMLVVGRHGRNVVPGAVLGSTSMGVLHHATCPVAVIPEG